MQRLDELRYAVAANARAGLPPLRGTEKQVAWAEVIRQRFWRTLEGIRGAMREGSTKIQYTNVDGLQVDFHMSRVAVTGRAHGCAYKFSDLSRNSGDAERL